MREKDTFFASAFNRPNDLEHYLENLPKDVNGRNIGYDIGIGDDTDLRRTHSMSMYNTIMTQKEMLIEYNQKLIEHGYGISKKEIKSKDTINLINICKYNDKKVGERIAIPVVSQKDLDCEFIERVGWLSGIPCLSEGVLKLNIGRFVHFKLKSLDIEQERVHLFLQDYTLDNGVWQVGVFGNVEVICKDSKKEIKMDVEIDNNTSITSFKDMYQLISYKELNWNQKKKEIWENITLRHAHESLNHLESHNTNNFMELVKLFMHFIIISNQMLDRHKPKAKRETKVEKQRRIQMAAQDAVNDQNRRITRTVGEICITSRKPPKKVTEEIVVRYKTASWTCRGGIRHMKSGKLVPFKASVRHRKCLHKQDTVPPTEIKFKH